MACYLYTTGMEREGKGGKEGEVEVEGERRVRWGIGGEDKLSLRRRITFLKGKV